MIYDAENSHDIVFGKYRLEQLIHKNATTQTYSASKCNKHTLLTTISRSYSAHDTLSLDSSSLSPPRESHNRKHSEEKYIIKREKKSMLIRQLRNEINILKKLQNTHCVSSIVELGHTVDYNYVVFKKVGQNCEAILTTLPNNRFELQDAIVFVIKSLESLQKIHDLNIIHRDIKPSNIVIDMLRGKLTFIDFGISTELNGRERDTLNENIIGTPKFCSPNAYYKRTLSKRDDLISLGYVLCYLYLGCLPWQASQLGPSVSTTDAIRHRKENNFKYLYRKSIPREFKIFIEYSMKLKHNETPDYSILINMFYTLLTHHNYRYEFTFVKDNARQLTEITMPHRSHTDTFESMT